MAQNKWSLQMKIVIGIASVVAVFAVIAGVIYGISAANREDVLVIPVSDADYGSEDEDSNTMDGQITTGSSQSVLYDPDKPIVEIKVKKGDRVKKGAALVVYDATQASDELEQKDLDVRSVDVALKKAQRTLDTLNAAQQVVVPEEEDDEDEEDEDGEDVTDTEESASDTENTETSDSKKTKRSKKSAKIKAQKIMSVMETAMAPADADASAAETTATEINAESTNTADASAATETTTTTTTEATTDTTTSDTADTDSEDTDEGPDFSDFNPGDTVYLDSTGEVYSATDLRKAKIEAENEIRSLTTDLAEANANLEAAQKAVADDTVTATLDGVVTQVKDPAESNLEAGEVVLTVSTFDGIFVNTALNEWALGIIDVGSKIYVTNWRNGKVYPARVTEISPYASQELARQYADSDTDDSYYPMTAIVEKDNAKLSDGDSVEVSLSKPEDYDGDEDEDEPIYLYKAFVVSEGENKYVYKADENGKLVKQKLEISGKETETYIVTGGITEDDYIAFPFGDNIREGANTVEGEIDDLYEDYY